MATLLQPVSDAGSHVAHAPTGAAVAPVTHSPAAPGLSSQARASIPAALQAWHVKDAAAQIGVVPEHCALVAGSQRPQRPVLSTHTVPGVFVAHSPPAAWQPRHIFVASSQMGSPGMVQSAELEH